MSENKQGDGAKGDACAVCGKVSDYDLGACEECDAFLCDYCGVHAYHYVFCSHKCKDEWARERCDDGVKGET